jgi:hypothetical protein
MNRTSLDVLQVHDERGGTLDDGHALLVVEMLSAHARANVSEATPGSALARGLTGLAGVPTRPAGYST